MSHNDARTQCRHSYIRHKRKRRVNRPGKLKSGEKRKSVLWSIDSADVTISWKSIRQYITTPIIAHFVCWERLWLTVWRVYSKENERSWKIWKCYQECYTFIQFARSQSLNTKSVVNFMQQFIMTWVLTTHWFFVFQSNPETCTQICFT